MEKRFVALAAVAFAVLPFLLAAIPGIRGRSTSSEVIAAAAGLLAIGFTGGLALILGSNVIGRDLSENRLSFYFCRPVGAASIWFGKVTAALALIAGAFAIILVPARLGAASGWQRSWGGSSPALLVLGGAMMLFFTAHVIGSFVRSRSAWIAIDFVAFLVAAYVVYLILSPLYWHGAELAMKTLMGIIGAGVIVALIGGGAWQLERGRTDRKRSHVALSQFVWGAIAAGLVLAGLLVAWMASAKPRDLEQPFVSLPRSGSWTLVGGEGHGRLDYPLAFLYNTDSGAYKRFSAERLWRTAFTPDGKTLLVARADVRHGQAELFQRALDGDSDEVSTGLTMPLSSDFVTTEGGDRVATMSGSVLSIYDVARRQSVGSVRLPGGQNDLTALWFASPDTVRVVMLAGNKLRLLEFDAARRVLQQTGELPVDGRGVGVSANADGSRLIVRNDKKGFYVIDGRTAAVQFAYPMPGLHSSVLLHDGGIAVSRTTDTGVVVDIVDPAGKLARSITLPVLVPGPIRELRDGRLVMWTRVEAQANGELATMVLDPASGTIVKRIPGAALLESSAASRMNFDPRRPQIDVPQVYRTTKGELTRWNPSTNRAEPFIR